MSTIATQDASQAQYQNLPMTGSSALLPEAGAGLMLLILGYALFAAMRRPKSQRDD